MGQKREEGEPTKAGDPGRAGNWGRRAERAPRSWAGGHRGRNRFWFLFWEWLPRMKPVARPRGGGKGQADRKPQNS